MLNVCPTRYMVSGPCSREEYLKLYDRILASQDANQVVELPSPYFGKMDHRKYWYWNHRIWSCWEERAQLWTSEFVLKIMPTINSVWWDAVRFAKQAVVWQHWFGWMAKWLTQRSAKPLFVGLNPTSTSEIRNNDQSTRKGSENSDKRFTGCPYCGNSSSAERWHSSQRVGFDSLFPLNPYSSDKQKQEH